MSPTLAVQATSAGLILGTAGYMSRLNVVLNWFGDLNRLSPRR